MRKVKEQAFKYYKRWRNEKTYSPAFKTNIRVSLKGWRHITGATGTKKRAIDDVYRRLKLLPHAKAIIKKSTTIQNVSKYKGKTYYTLEAIRMVKEGKRVAPRKVRVILVEDKKTKEKVFLSVMDKKFRKRRRKKKKPQRVLLL